MKTKFMEAIESKVLCKRAKQKTIADISYEEVTDSQPITDIEEYLVRLYIRWTFIVPVKNLDNLVEAKQVLVDRVDNDFYGDIRYKCAPLFHRLENELLISGNQAAERLLKELKSVIYD